MHLRHAFHGRSGYTLSLTNTDPVKVSRFPKFDWPRIESPALRFPLADYSDENRRSEDEAIDQVSASFAANPHRITCFVAEPIQAEGGDRHLSARFLGAVQELCAENDALFVLDEVQTGVGVTGTRWAYESLSLEPDVVAFAKKVQLGGIMAGRRVDEEPENVFEVPGRISSTWGGGLVDMVRVDEDSRGDRARRPRRPGCHRRIQDAERLGGSGVGEWRALVERTRKGPPLRHRSSD